MDRGLTLQPTSVITGLDVRHVSKSYVVNGVSFRAVQDVSFHVPHGKFVSIVGPSGCGKSTVLRMLAGLETADSGALTAHCKPIIGTSVQRAIVFQDHRLLPWLTIARNVELALQRSHMAREEKRHAVLELLDLVGLGAFANAYPRQLSGGMSQRAALARSLVARPTVLLLDEPTGALDAFTRRQMQLELHRIWGHYEITGLMVTHDVDEALFLSSHVIVMDKMPGRIRAIVTVESDSSLRQAQKLQIHDMLDGTDQSFA